MGSIYDIIKKRISVRSYSDKTCEENKKKELMDYLEARHTGPFGHEVRFRLVEASDYDLEEIKKLGTYGMIRGAKLYLAGAVVTGEKSMEDFGCCMEDAVLKATEMGLGTCWLGGSLDRSVFGQKIGIREGEVIPAVTPLGYPSEIRSQEDETVRKRVDADNRKGFDELFFFDFNKKPLDRAVSGKYGTALEALRLSPSASNKQPWRIIFEGGEKPFHFYLDEDFDYNNRFKDIKLQNLDIGIAMCHFELVSRELGLNGKWVDAKPGIDPGKLIYIASWVSR